MRISVRRAGTTALVVGVALAASGHVSAKVYTASNPSFRPAGAPTDKLTEAQAVELSIHQPANNRVIIIFKDQYLGRVAPDHAVSATRSSVIQSSQHAVLSDMRQGHATDITAFHLINAVGAHVTTAEERYLKTLPTVRAIVPDERISLPKPVGVAPDGGRPTGSQSRRAASPARCSAVKPKLEPEALTQIHDRSGNPRAKNEATQIVRGKGVRIGIMASGIDMTNPDFIRPNGKPIFVDAEDFSGPDAAPPGGDNEGMLDASSIGAQGNERYFIGNFTNPADPAYNHTNACPVIRVVGAAPGASLVQLGVLGSLETITGFIQGIQYATDHGVNVLNESFGENYYPDAANDPIALADQAAIDEGVVVVVSSGDGGVNGTNNTPSTVRGAIAVGATTSFQIYKQLGDSGFQLSNGKYKDSQISSLSSGGSAQTGEKSVDVVAPGDLNWSLCDQGNPGCFNDTTGVVQEGGTSESAPLTASVAALIIQAYRKSHGGHTPTPEIVKQIIMSSARNLDLPSALQGAGLLNAYKAVQMALSYGESKRVGDDLAVNANNCAASTTGCNLALSAKGLSGSKHALRFSLTNEGKDSETVKPASRMLKETDRAVVNTKFNRDSDPTFIDQFGVTRAYQTATYHVSSGTAQLDSAVSWNPAANGGNFLVRLDLLSPNGTFSGFSLPFNPGNGLARVIVRDPAPGNWKLIMWTYLGSTGYTGPIQISDTTYKFVAAGSLSPNCATIAPGQTKKFVYHATVPPRTGDDIGDIHVKASARGEQGVNMTIPVILRSFIPSGNSTNAFSGTILGGNGTNEFNQQTFQFKVPAGENDLSLDIKLPEASTEDNLEAIITTPDGEPVDMQSNQVALDGNGIPIVTNAMQFFRMNPEPGDWTLTLILVYYSGPRVTEPFNGSLSFNAVNASSRNLPDDTSTMVSPSSPVHASVTVTNTGKTTESYYLDPRQDSTTKYVVGGGDSKGTPVGFSSFFVPPFSSGLSVKALDTDKGRPVNILALNENGTYSADGPTTVYGAAFTPDVFQSGSPAGGLAELDYSAPEVDPGLWFTSFDDLQPGQSAGTDDLISKEIVTTKTFDQSITSNTGDLWLYDTGVTNTFDYTPLILAPGATGTIKLTITPDGGTGAVDGGNIYLNTVQFEPEGTNGCSGGFCATTGSGGDEVKAFPYTYTTGRRSR